MIRAACPRCVVNGRPGVKWEATGRFNTSRRYLVRAELVCSVCQYSWASGCFDAIEAGAWMLHRNLDEHAEPEPVSIVPQPELAGVRSTPSAQPFAPMRNLATAVAADFKRRAGGDE